MAKGVMADGSIIYLEKYANAAAEKAAVEAAVAREQARLAKEARKGKFKWFGDYPRLDPNEGDLEFHIIRSNTIPNNISGLESKNPTNPEQLIHLWIQGSNVSNYFQVNQAGAEMLESIHILGIGMVDGKFLY